jgi:hypothetical protein
MTAQDKSQLSSFPPKDEKEAQKELDRLRKYENETFKSSHKRTGFEDKSIWDWLQLLAALAVPLILGIATIGFGLLQIHLADMQHQQDQKNALDQQQAAILQTYIDNIQDLLLNHYLLKSSAFDLNRSYNDVAVLARARTLTALHALDPERKGRLLIFLYEAGLISYYYTEDKPRPPIIDISGAYLHDADLSGVDLHDIYLSGANLSGSSLTYADFWGTNLQGANFQNTDLSFAFQLFQRPFDQVYTCKGAFLPKGLKCHHN